MGITFWKACWFCTTCFKTVQLHNHLIKIFSNATRIDSPANVDKNHKILALYSTLQSCIINSQILLQISVTFCDRGERSAEALTWSRFRKNCMVILSRIWYSWMRAVKRWRTLISSFMIWSFCPRVFPFRDSNSAVLRWRSMSSWAFCCMDKTNINYWSYPLQKCLLHVQ